MITSHTIPFSITRPSGKALIIISSASQSEAAWSCSPGAQSPWAAPPLAAGNPFRASEPIQKAS